MSNNSFSQLHLKSVAKIYTKQSFSELNLPFSYQFEMKYALNKLFSYFSTKINSK